MKNRPNTRQHRLIHFGTATVLTIALAISAVFATPPPPPPASIAARPPLPGYTTTPEMCTETKIFAQIVQMAHYAKKPIKSLNGDDFIRDYLGNFDHSHLYFTKPELQAYQNRFAPLLDMYFDRGNLTPAFVIYKDFYDKLEKRIHWIDDRLKQPFDLNTNETFVIDRRKLDWPTNAAEADRLWENRLKLDLIFEILANEPTKTAATTKTANATTPAKTENGAKNQPPAKTTTSTDAKAPAKDAPLTPDPKLLADAIERVRKRYDKILTYLRIEPFEAQEIYLNTLGSEYDPHTTFFTRQSRQDFEVAMRNKLIGIGAVLRDEEGYCTIRDIVAGGPLEGAKNVRVGDRIVAIGQGNDPNGELTDVVGMRLNKIIAQLRGKEDSYVRLRIEPAADRANRYVITLKRAEIKLTTKLAVATLHEVPSSDNSRTIPIGVVELPAFYGKDDGDSSTFSTTGDVEELIEKLKKHKIEGLVLDLRRNGGGLLSEAARLTGLFVPQKHPVVQVKAKNDSSEALTTPERPAPLWEGPLVVLVTKMSASASEIVAGALQDHQRAIIVGDPQTHGKGSVQTILNYSNYSPEFGSAAKFTIQKWYLPSGKSIQLNGVAADISVPSVYSVLPISEADLEHPLPWDSIATSIQTPPANYIPAAGLASPALIERLRSLSENRQKNLPEFANLNRTIAWNKSRERTRAYPVSYTLLRAERTSDRDFLKDVRKTYANLAASQFKTTEIKLNSAIEQEAKERKAKEEREKADAEKAAAQKENTTAKTTEKTDAATKPADAAPKSTDTTKPADDSTKPAPAENDEDDEDSDLDDETETSDGKKNTNLDVQRREALRILSDWISTSPAPTKTTPAADKTAPTPKTADAPKTASNDAQVLCSPFMANFPATAPFPSTPHTPPTKLPASCSPLTI